MFAPKVGFWESGNLTASSKLHQTDPCDHANQHQLIAFERKIG